MTATTVRQTAEERREAVLAAAAHEFAHKGLHGGSTDAIARAAGISQPYLFRLFRTKKDLYLATCVRKMGEMVEAFRSAMEGLEGREALEAAGQAYQEMIVDRDRLLLMLQSHAACDDPDVREAVRAAWRELTDLIGGVSDVTDEEFADFFATGMLMTMLDAMQVFTDRTPWGDRLVEGARAKKYG
jgi:AcrR family transcriptional regulator